MSPTSPYFSNRGCNSCNTVSSQMDKALSDCLASTLTSEVVRKGRFPTRREVIRSTSDGGLRKDIFSPGRFLSEKCVEILVKLKTYLSSWVWSLYQINLWISPVPASHNTHSVPLDVFSFVIRREARCHTIMTLRVRLYQCHARSSNNKIHHWELRDKHFYQQCKQRQKHVPLTAEIFLRTFCIKRLHQLDTVTEYQLFQTKYQLVLTLDRVKVIHLKGCSGLPSVRS